MRKLLALCVSSMMLLMVTSVAYSDSIATDRWQTKVSLDVKDTPLPAALDALVKTAGISYTLDPSLIDRKVTIKFVEVPLREAFSKLVDIVGATYDMRDVSCARIWPKTPMRANQTQTTGQGTIIKTHYVNATDLAAVLRRTLGDNCVHAVDNTTLGMTDNKEVADRAHKIIAEIDTESAMRRKVTINAVTTMTWTPSGGKPITVSPSSTISAVDGEDAEVNVYISRLRAPDQHSKVYTSSVNETQLKLRPTIMPAQKPAGPGEAERIAVSGTGTVLWGPSLTNANHTFSWAASLKPGVPTVVASSTCDLPVGRFDIEVKLTARIGEGLAGIGSMTPNQQGQMWGGGYGSRGF